MTESPVRQGRHQRVPRQAAIGPRQHTSLPVHHAIRVARLQHLASCSALAWESTSIDSDSGAIDRLGLGRRPIAGPGPRSRSQRAGAARGTIRHGASVPANVLAGGRAPAAGRPDALQIRSRAPSHRLQNFAEERPNRTAFLFKFNCNDLAPPGPVSSIAPTSSLCSELGYPASNTLPGVFCIATLETSADPPDTDTDRQTDRQTAPAPVALRPLLHFGPRARCTPGPAPIDSRAHTRAALAPVGVQRPLSHRPPPTHILLPLPRRHIPS